MDSDGDRPPADIFFHEVFNDRKCVPDPKKLGRDLTPEEEEARKRFWTWCLKPFGTQLDDVTCTRIGGSEGPCKFNASFTEQPLYEIQKSGAERASFDYLYNSALDIDEHLSRSANSISRQGKINATTQPPNLGTNATTTTTTTTVRPDKTSDKLDLPKRPDKTVYMNYNHVCSFGGSPEKDQNTTASLALEPDKYEAVTRFCYGEIYPGIAWYWILLIVLAIILAVGITAGFFYKYYLKKRLRKRPPKSHLGSTIRSHWTLSPVSTTDAPGSRQPSRSLSRSSSRSRVPVSGSRNPSSMPSSSRVSSSRASSSMPSSKPSSVSSGSSLRTLPTKTTTKQSSLTSRSTSSRPKTTY